MDNRREGPTWLVQYDRTDRTLVIGTDGGGGRDGKGWVECEKFPGSFFKICMARLIKMWGPMYFKNIPQMILMPCLPTWESMIQANYMVDLFLSVNKESWMVTHIRHKHSLGRSSYWVTELRLSWPETLGNNAIFISQPQPITKLFNTFCQQFHTFHLSGMGKLQYSQNV